MSVIKPRTRGKELIRHITRLDRVNYETLYAYAKFLGEETEYVLNQLVESVLAKDREFVAWRKEHAESYVPTPTPAPAKREHRRAASSEPVAHPSRPTAPASLPTSI